MHAQFGLTALILGLTTSLSFAQSNANCDSILNKEITAMDVQEYSGQFTYDLQTMLLCEFDSIDCQLLMGPYGKMPLVLQSVLTLDIKTDKEDQTITFNDVKNILQELKLKPGYAQARSVVEAKNELFQRAATTSDWGTDKELLIKMGLVQYQLDDIYGIVKENELKPYSDILLIYADTLSKQNNRETAHKSLSDSIQKSDSPKPEEWIKGLPAYRNYEGARAKSKEVNKPLLLYFNGHGNANSRKIEEFILAEKNIQDYINTHLVFTSLIVDERTMLPDSTTYYSETLKKEVRTIGLKNLELEIKEFNSNSQPLFVLLNVNGKEISRIEYTNSVREFELFLKTVED
jgi:thioredoxin-related protein